MSGCGHRQKGLLAGLSSRLSLWGHVTTTRALVRIFFGLWLSMFCPSFALGQSTPATSENQLWPEGDVHVEFPSNLRLLTFAGVEQGVGYPYQQWYAAAALGYQFKPILRPHRINIDPDKEHYFLFGGGYEFLRTIQSGKVKNEDRITIDVTLNVRPLARLLLQNRNWVELRWIDGAYSTTYRNMSSGQGDFRIHGVRLSPYGAAEFFYDSQTGSWNQEWYTAGVQWPSERRFMLDTYYRREHCPTCTPQNWNVGGVTLNFFFGKWP